MMLIVLFIVAVLVAKYEFKGKIDSWVVFTARWAPVLSASLWLGGGLFTMLGVLAFFQAVYVPARNFFEEKDTWFIDEASFFGKLIKKYLSKYIGKYGNRTLYIAELVLGLTLILF